MVIDRSRRLSLLISDEEHAMLTALSERDGITVSDWVRLTLRRSYAETFGDKRPSPKKK